MQWIAEERGVRFWSRGAFYQQTGDARATGREPQSRRRYGIIRDCRGG